MSSLCAKVPHSCAEGAASQGEDHEVAGPQGGALCSWKQIADDKLKSEGPVTVEARLDFANGTATDQETFKLATDGMSEEKMAQLRGALDASISRATSAIAEELSEATRQLKATVMSRLQEVNSEVLEALMPGNHLQVEVEDGDSPARTASGRSPSRKASRLASSQSAGGAIHRSEAFEGNDEVVRTASYLTNRGGVHGNHTLELRPEWVEGCEGEIADLPNVRSVMAAGLSLGDGGIGSKSDSRRRSGDTIEGTSCMSRIMVRPSGRRKICWDLLSVLVLGHDILVIPMMVFDLPDTSFSAFMGLFTTLFWTCDCIINFTVGYHTDGVIEMRPTKVAINYMKSWFVIDLTIISTDWTLLITDTADNISGALRMGKSVRLARILRIFRLLRVMKVMNILDSVGHALPGESVLTVFHILKLLAAISGINHFIACAWYGFGKLTHTYPEYRASWLNDLKPVDDKSLFYMYTSSLHWSITQFTPASMEVVPRNATERVFSVCIIIFALVMFSSFISSITQAMTRLRAINEEKIEQQENTRRYISENRVSLELGNRIRNFLQKHHRMAKRRIHESDIPALKAMPEGLMVELRSEVFLPIINIHPLFNRISSTCSASAVNICYFCMQEKSLRSSEELFTYGDQATHVFFLNYGLLEYYYGGLGNGAQGTPLHDGQQICEMVLWMPWKYMGRLQAMTHCEMVTVQGKMFSALMCHLRAVSLDICRQYAAGFLEAVLMFENRGKLSDTCITPTVTAAIASHVFEGENLEDLLDHELDPGPVEKKPGEKWGIQKGQRWLQGMLSPKAGQMEPAQ